MVKTKCAIDGKWKDTAKEAPLFALRSAVLLRLNRLSLESEQSPVFGGISCYMRRLLLSIATIGSIILLGVPSLSQITVTMDISADETYRVFLGNSDRVFNIIATDWDDCNCRWTSAESYTFSVNRGDYIYVVASNHYGPSMLLARLVFNDGKTVYSGIENSWANWEVSEVFRGVLTTAPPPDLDYVNEWISRTTTWEKPSVGGVAGINWPSFAYLQPARYIWKYPGGSSVWGFSGYTGPGTALFRIPVPAHSYLKFEIADAETKVSIPGVLLVLSAYDKSDQVAVETTSDGSAVVPIDEPRFDKTYSLQIFPRRYYRRNDSSVVTYLTPTAGSTGGGTDIAVRIESDGSAVTAVTLVDRDTRYHWGDVYWRLTTGYPAKTLFAVSDWVITLPIQLVPVRLERTESPNVVQYSLDQLAQAVTTYNTDTAKANKRVPPHIAYANCMVEIGGEDDLAYTAFQNEYWTIVNKKGEQPYAHIHHAGLTNCTEEHTDSGFGHGQISGLHALRRIRTAEQWLKLLRVDPKKKPPVDRANAISKAVAGLAELARPGANIYAMLDYLNERYSAPGDRAQIASWQTAIQAYNPGETDRLEKAWVWLTKAPRGTIRWQIPIPANKYQSAWDTSLKDANFDGWLDDPLKPPPVGVD